MQSTKLILVLFFLEVQFVFSQSSSFDVNLRIDYTSAEQTIALLEDQLVNTQSLAELRGNRIAAATTGMIANRVEATVLLKNYLDSLKYHQQILDDVYHLEEARKNVSAMKELLQEMKKRNFSQRVVATVKQIFPEDVAIATTIPMYVVALGHENVNAYVRRITWKDDVPMFLGGDKGELTIIINLARSVMDEDNLDDRFISLLGVVAHEVFHAAFGVYKELSPVWKEWKNISKRPIHILLDLTQNEGIAYYLSLEQEGRGYLPRDWDNRMIEAFATFNKGSEELLSDRLTMSKANEILRQANLSGYWESFGSMTGMFIAREIDRMLGRAALIETISKNPIDFFQKYSTLTKQNTNLPKLSGRVEAFIELLSHE
jgi:hypothetical protein